MIPLSSFIPYEDKRRPYVFLGGGREPSLTALEDVPDLVWWRHAGVEPPRVRPLEPGCVSVRCEDIYSLVVSVIVSTWT